MVLNKRVESEKINKRAALLFGTLEYNQIGL